MPKLVKGSTKLAHCTDIGMARPNECETLPWLLFGDNTAHWERMGRDRDNRQTFHWYHDDAVLVDAHFTGITHGRKVGLFTADYLVAQLKTTKSL